MATYASHRLIMEKSENCQFLLSCWRYLNFVFAEMFISRVEFSNEKSEGCCIYRHAGIDYIALWDSLLPLREVFAAYLGTCV